MRILLAAPKICPPWTEGRKRFVRDLASGFSRHHEVHVVTTADPGEQPLFAAETTCVPASGGFAHLLGFHRALERCLRIWQPDWVCHLPIGSFHKHYRYGNLASLWLADRQCRIRGLSCLTVMYAIARESSAVKLARYVKHLLANDETAGTRRIRFGMLLGDSDRPAPTTDRDGKALLFMAGMSEPTTERLEHVLSVRGLGEVLRAGRWLAPAGYRLTLAVPLLESSMLRQRLLDHTDNAWPVSALEFKGIAAVPEIFSEHDFFVFPYGREETTFVPTSVIEAMNAGLACVLPERQFLSDLHDTGRTALSYRPGNGESLARCLLAAAGRTGLIDTLRIEAWNMVQMRYSIDGTCADLLDYYHQINAIAGRNH